jgi:G6PDH family F420-dependent oxidoreductase
MKFGYFLSCEEYTPAELVEQAAAAADAGFEALWISDHFHPWNNEQGQSPLVWSVIGAVSQVCDLPVTTAVTCPIMRVHPAIVAQAAATSAVMLDGRFTLGVGTGEALNESITGRPWPPAAIRLEMLEEAVDLIRRLWEGGQVTHRGRYYQLDNARIYTRPDTPPEIYMSAFGPAATDVAVRIADGYMSTMADSELLTRFKDGTGGKPAQAGVKVAYADTAVEGVQHAHRLWSNAGLPGELAQILPTPAHFEQASQLVTEEATGSSVTAGKDVRQHVKAVQEYVDAGYDEVFVANMGPHYRDMIRFYGDEVLPELRRRSGGTQSS